MENQTRQLSPEQTQALLGVLMQRFNQNPARHAGITWDEVLSRLQASPAKLWSIHEMEESGGAPDVVVRAVDGAPVFMDCSPETPAGRRNLCYDEEAREKRKEHKPAGSALAMAERMGVELLSEEEYRALQKLGHFDAKTSSWVKTPSAIRKLGGALFCDYRYGTVFTYHNGADSYYGARGFRTLLKV
jgi:hypothetical protein